MTTISRSLMVGVAFMLTSTEPTQALSGVVCDKENALKHHYLDFFKKHVFHKCSETDDLTETDDLNQTDDYVNTSDNTEWEDSTNALDIVRRASISNSAFLPIPESVMNDQVRNYVPTQKAKIFTFSNGDYEYHIYDGIAEEDLRARERKEKAAFNSWIVKKNLIIPEPFRTNNEDLRFIVSNQYDYQYAYDSMVKNEQWMINHQANLFKDYEKYLPILNSGVVYGLGRDKQQRPIFVQNLRRIIDKGYSDEHTLDSFDFFSSYSQYHGMIPGAIESWTYIIDFKDVSVSEFPVGLLREANRRSTEAYHVRLHNLVVVNVDWKVNMLTKFIWKFINARIAAKIHVVEDNGKDILLKLAGKGNLEKKYGGTLPNVKKNFWPPRFNL